MSSSRNGKLIFFFCFIVKFNWWNLVIQARRKITNIFIIRPYEKTHHNVTEDKFSSITLLVLPYHDNFANISQVLKIFHVSVCFKNNCTVNKLIKNSPQFNEGCLYTLPCKNCNRFYIGQTGKTLEQRNKEHKYSVRTGQQSNALFIHVRDTNHSID